MNIKRLLTTLLFLIVIGQPANVSVFAGQKNIINMKNRHFLILITFILTTILTPNTFAQDSPQWHLPEGAKARFGKGTIQEIQYSPDGTQLAVASSIGIWIYDAQTGEELDLLSGHPDKVERVAFSPDGNILASVGWEGTIFLWDVSTGTHIRTLSGRVESISFSPDGNILAGGSGGETRLWDVSTGTHIRTITGQSQVESVSFSPDGKTLATRDTDGMIFLWDVSTGTHIRTLSGHTRWVYSLSFSPDGKTLASAGGSRDNTIRLWEVSTGKNIRTITEDVGSVSFSPDGNILASASRREIRLWEVSTGKNIRTIAWNYVKSLSFSPDGNTLAGGSGGEIRLFDVSTGTHIKTISGHTAWGKFSPDGNTLASVSGNEIHLFDVSTSTHIRTLSGHTERVYSISFSPDGNTLASGGGSYKKSNSCLHCVSWEGSIRLWEVSTGKNIKTIAWNYVGSLSFSPDGNTLAGGSGNEIHLFDVSTGTHIKTLFGGHACNIQSLSFSPDGKTLASGNSKRTIFLFDVSTGTHIKTLTGHTSHVERVSFSPDGNTLASRGWDVNDGIRLWDVSTWTHIRTLTGHTGRVRSISFSPDGNTLVSGSGFFDGTIRLWDVSTGENIKTLTGHTNGVHSVSFSPDGNTLASGGGGYDGTIRLWDVSTGENIKTLTGHTENYIRVLFSPDGTTLASESRDGTLLLWELNPTRTALLEDVNNDGVVNITDLTLVASNFGATGSHSADVNGDGVVNIVDLTRVAAAFGNTAGAPFMLRRDSEIAPTKTDVEKWLNAARQLNLTDPNFQRGIHVLENLLKVLTPKETALLPNYPNPFNPETWIPYQLANPAEVTLTIYAADGKVVRKLEIGHKTAGIYQEKKRAAYWDGKNTLGEPVASGVYFYTLTADSFTATRKMLIQK
ncbi:MAG: T9SS type A sorting domain-containing protein [Candidatus Poribacteria bacterium]|nr:T9SS type A sorting domain-containing protein [Candidatus Poribacteria bacterium]